MSFKYKIYELFNSLSTRKTPLLWKEISRVITGKDTFDKGTKKISRNYMHINRLINIFLLNPNNVRRLSIPANKLKILRESCYYYTVKILSDNAKVPS